MVFAGSMLGWLLWGGGAVSSAGWFVGLGVVGLVCRVRCGSDRSMDGMRNVVGFARGREMEGRFDMLS